MTNNLAEENKMKPIFKTYTKRDSATAVLRKMGIDKADYNKFIEAVGSNGFRVDLASAKNFVDGDYANPAEPKLASKIDKKSNQSIKDLLQATSITKKEKSEKKENISSVARKAIIDGANNAEVWALLVEKFKLDDSKKHYPSWYRSELKRTGKIK